MNKSTGTLSNPTLERCITERYTITEDRDKKKEQIEIKLMQLNMIEIKSLVRIFGIIENKRKQCIT